MIHFEYHRLFQTYWQCIGCNRWHITKETSMLVDLSNVRLCHLLDTISFIILYRNIVLSWNFFPIYFIYINHFYVKSESFSVFINLCGSSQRLDQKYILNSIIRKMTDYVAKGQSIVQSGPRLANLSPSTKVVGDYGRMEDLANWMDSCLLTITSSSSSLTSRDDWWFVYVPDRVPCTTNTTN